MKDLWQLKREFLEHCEIEKGQSKLTIENYGRYLDRFLSWLKDNTEETTRSHTGYKEDTATDLLHRSAQIGKQNDLITTTDLLHRSAQMGSKAEGLNIADKLTANKLTPELITEETVRQYRLYINRLSTPDGGELKLTTQNHHVLALRAFLRYLLSRGIAVLPPEKISLAKIGEREINFLNQEEYGRLLNAPNTKDFEGIRDRAVLETLFSTGMRVSEIVNCNIGRLNLEQGEISILGKGKKLRVVFLSESACYWLVKYLTMRGAVINQKSKIKNQKENMENTTTDLIHGSAQIGKQNDVNTATDLLYRSAQMTEYKNEETTRIDTDGNGANQGIKESRNRESEGHDSNDAEGNRIDTEKINKIVNASEVNQSAKSNTENQRSNNHYSLLIINDLQKNDPLFLSSRGNRMNARAVERLIKKYKRIAGISKDISPHSLRHTFATDLLSAGADIRSVQSMLGHSNLSTTQIYTHVTDQHLREVHKKFHGKNENTTTDLFH